jgi:Relaxase/Mobilisation nuclease domain
MPIRRNDAAMLDLRSYGRPGPGQRDRLSPAQIDQIRRTVGRTPEVMVKVLPKGASSGRGVKKHLDYIGRKGDVDLVTDDGQTLTGDSAADGVLEEWDLDLDEHRRHRNLLAGRGRDPPRLVHKIIFSMPKGTPANKVLAAVRITCREEFALKHRYAMALHTDEPHPHVHVVIKAVSEKGVRLNVSKATLRDWRSEFARHLREQGVAANATERAVRGQTRTSKADAIYRATLRGESTHMRTRVGAVAAELTTGGLQMEHGKSTLMATRREVERGWRAVSDILVADGQPELAAQVRRFVDQMSPPRTEKEQIAINLLERDRLARAREEAPPSR